jgi:CheY-like chemotaxis protein
MKKTAGPGKEAGMNDRPYILIVDDDPDILEGIIMILETLDFRLETARDGAQCLEILQREKPDLLILDLLMPRMDGWGVIRSVRRDQAFSDMPILILTTVIEDASRRRYELETGMAMDIQDYVQKPARPEDLISRVNSLLAWKK